MEKYTDEKKYQELADKWLSGKITDEEEVALFEYYDLNESEEIIIPKEFNGNESFYKDFLFRKISKKINAKKNTNLKLWLWSSAAAVFLVIGFILFQTFSFPPKRLKNTVVDNHYSSPIAEFSDPVLVLDDGSKIRLSKDRISALAKERGLNITQDNRGKLVYTVHNESGNAVLFNELKTPVGQQLTINLSDGTKVFLNAGSSLRFPTVFNTSKREVHLSGEAYFEVAKNKIKPFKVYTANQEVEVLGTHFNINAYENESFSRTTLVEGKVKVKAKNVVASSVLEPGQESVVQIGNLVVSEVDVSDALAWRLGYFKFNNEDLESIMRKLQRWYNIEVVYETQRNPNLAFNGRISQTKSIASILKIIEESGNVHFKIEGRRVTVLK